MGGVEARVRASYKLCIAIYPVAERIADIYEAIGLAKMVFI